MFRSVRLEHLAAFNEHGRHDVMPAAKHIVGDLVDQVAALDAAGPVVPQVMMRVADRQFGLEGGLLHAIEPRLIG